MTTFLDQLGGRPARWWAAAGLAALAGIVGWWTWRALHDPHGYDFRLFYKAGQIAWATGRPEHQSTWTGTPLLAAVMALVTRVISLRGGSDVLTVINTALVVAVVAVVLGRLRGVLTGGWWWGVALALLSFGPMLSTVWWKQLNIIALVLALAGFELLRRERASLAGALIGLSVAIKPLVFLLPVVLLIPRQTRRAAALAIAWAIGLTIAGQALLAVRAHDVGVLSPTSALDNFFQKARPGHGYACMPINFSPASLVCRLAGSGDWTLVRVLSWVAVAILGLWALEALRGRGPRSWELFAFLCPLSAMASPLEWSHYQILLAPLFVLLAARFATAGSSPGAWIGLAAAFVLASLMWEPYGTLTGAIARRFVAHPPPISQQVQDAFSVAAVAQFAQYVLLVTALLWFERPSRPPARSLRPPSPS